MNDLTKVQVHFSGVISEKFIVNCIEEILILKNPLYQKLDFEKEPKDVQVLIKSSGKPKVSSKDSIVNIEIMLEISVKKKFQTFFSSFEKEIDFKIEILHSFKVNIESNWKVDIHSIQSKFEWQKKPTTTFFYLEFDITKYVEPILKEFCTKLPTEIYPKLISSFEENIDNYVTKLSDTFIKSFSVKTNVINIWLHKLQLEKNLISKEGLNINGALELCVLICKDEKKKIRPPVELEIIDFLYPKKTKSFECVSLGKLNENNPFTFHLMINVPYRKLFSKLLPVDSLLLTATEGIATLQAFVKKEIIFKKTKFECNDFSFMVEIPLFLKVVKLGVIRTCSIHVYFILGFIFSEMGIQVKECKGEFLWIDKPSDFKAFGITMINVEKELESSLKQRIEKIQKHIFSTITKSLEILENNSSFIFPQFSEKRTTLKEVEVGTGKFGFYIDRNNSRYISLSMIEDNLDSLQLELIYQAPVSSKTGEEVISKEVNFKKSFDELKMNYF